LDDWTSLNGFEKWVRILMRKDIRSPLCTQHQHNKSRGFLRRRRLVSNTDRFVGGTPDSSCPSWVIRDGGQAASKPGHVRYAAEAEVSKRSPGERSEIRDHVEIDPHIAEPVIGRAFARPVGSCGLQLRSLCALVGTLRYPPCQLRCVNCFASRASAVSICELRQINPTGKSATTCPVLRAKIFRLTRRANQCSFFACLTQLRGGSRSSRTCGGMRWTRNARETNARDAYGEVVWS
jgi:hypothetical protein